jgi:hypothetical protein
MAGTNSMQGMFDKLTLKQTERLLRITSEGAAALPRDPAGNATASEIYGINADLDAAWHVKFDKIISKSRKSRS